MRNRRLLDAIEAYVMADKTYSLKPNNEKFLKLKDVRSRLEVVLAVESTIEDITELFSDLRDYWDTLEISK